MWIGWRGQALLVATVAVFYHVWNLGGEYIFDDGIYIVMNPAVQMGLGDWTRFFTDPGTYAGIAKNHYRPLVALSYAANVSMGGGIVGFKVTQVLLHVCTSLGLFWVVRRLVRDFKLDLPGAPLLAAGLFAAMPFNVEAVHYLTARSAVLCGLFSVISVGLFLELRRNASRTGRMLLYLAHLAALVLALLSKETALTLPGVLLLIDLLRVSRNGTADTFRSARFWWPYLPYVAGLGLALVVMPNVNLVMSYFAQVFGQEWRLAAAIFCLVENIRLMLVPIGLTLAHPINEAGRLLDPLTLGCAAVVVALLGSALVLWRRAPLWTLGVVWYFLLIAPSTFVHLNTVLMENRGYTASMGVSLAAAGVMAALWTIQPRRRAVKMVLSVSLAMVAVLFFAVGYQRQQVWAANLTEWQDAVRHNPSSEEAWANLGKAHFDRGEWPEAEAADLRVLRLRPDALPIMVNLAGVYLKEGRYQRALKLMRPLVAAVPDHPVYLTNLYQAQRALGRDGEALDTLHQLLEAEALNRVKRRYANRLMPGQSATAMVSLALKLGRTDDAAWAIDSLRRTDPGYPLIGLLEMRLYVAKGEFDKAEVALAALATRLSDDDPRLPGWREALARYRRAAADR